MTTLYRVRDPNTEDHRGAVYGDKLTSQQAHILKEKVVGDGHSRTAFVEPMDADQGVIGHPTHKPQHMPGIGYIVDAEPPKKDTSHIPPFKGGYIVDPPSAKPIVAVGRRNPPKPIAMVVPTLQSPIVHGASQVGAPAPDLTNPSLAAARAATLAAAKDEAVKAQIRSDHAIAHAAVQLATDVVADSGTLPGEDDELGDEDDDELDEDIDEATQDADIDLANEHAKTEDKPK